MKWSDRCAAFYRTLCPLLSYGCYILIATCNALSFDRQWQQPLRHIACVTRASAVQRRSQVVTMERDCQPIKNSLTVSCQSLSSRLGVCCAWWGSCDTSDSGLPAWQQLWYELDSATTHVKYSHAAITRHCTLVSCRIDLGSLQGGSFCALQGLIDDVIRSALTCEIDHRLPA